MKIWIHIDGQRRGPYELDQLPTHLIKPDTPVWYQGLDYWIVAAESPHLRHLWDAPPVQQQAPPQPPHAEAPAAPAPEQSRQPEPMQGDCGHPAPAQEGYPRYNPAQGGYPHQSPMPAGCGQPMSAQGGCGHPTPPGPCPPSYLVWSVLLTVLCCNPIGIIPIALGSSIKGKYLNFDYEGARRQSETTAIWLMVTIVTSLIIAPASLLLSI